MKFLIIVFAASQTLSSTCALQILADGDIGLAPEPVGPSDAEYNEMFHYIQCTEDSAKVQVDKVRAFLDREGADVNKIVVITDNADNDKLNFAHAVARSICGLKHNEVLARALAGKPADAHCDWRVFTAAQATKVAVLDVLMEKYNVNLNILLEVTHDSRKFQDQVLRSIVGGMELSRTDDPPYAHQDEMDQNMAKV